MCVVFYCTVDATTKVAWVENVRSYISSRINFITMTALETPNWNGLPDDIIISVFSYLSLQEKYHAALVCKAWYECFLMPPVWFRFRSYFYLPKQDTTLRIINRYAKYIKSLYIELDQATRNNRDNACQVLTTLSRTGGRKVSSLTIKFTGSNPLFFSGQEFMDALTSLFGPPLEGVQPPTKHLLEVDLSGLNVPYSDGIFRILGENNPELQTLNIQNKILVCKVTSAGLLEFVNCCTKLKDLRVYHCSMSDEILEALATEDREPIQHLGIACRREEKYSRDLSSEAWCSVVRRSPRLRVTLWFDHTCPFMKIAMIMKRDIPIIELRLETSTRLEAEVFQAVLYYHSTLEKLVLFTIKSRGLNEALLYLADKCKRIKSLYVNCILRQNVIERILNKYPEMKEKKTFLLKSESPEPEVYVVGQEVDEHILQL
ncbi:hypothetical protein ScPMuIL_000433 [Solemya velum]